MDCTSGETGHCLGGGDLMGHELPGQGQSVTRMYFHWKIINISLLGIVASVQHVLLTTFVNFQMVIPLSEEAAVPRQLNLFRDMAIFTSYMNLFPFQIIDIPHLGIKVLMVKLLFYNHQWLDH